MKAEGTCRRTRYVSGGEGGLNFKSHEKSLAYFSNLVTCSFLLKGKVERGALCHAPVGLHHLLLSRESKEPLTVV